MRSYHNTKTLLEGNLLDAFTHYKAGAIKARVRMGDDVFTKALYEASILLKSVDYGENNTRRSVGDPQSPRRDTCRVLQAISDFGSN